MGRYCAQNRKGTTRQTVPVGPLLSVTLTGDTDQVNGSWTDGDLTGHLADLTLQVFDIDHWDVYNFRGNVDMTDTPQQWFTVPASTYRLKVDTDWDMTFYSPDLVIT